MPNRLSKRTLWIWAAGLTYLALAGLAYAVGHGPVVSGCSVGGFGRITAADGDPASFRGLAGSAPVAGLELYRDAGPANALRIRSLGLKQLTCGGAASSATASGTASANGSARLGFRIDFRLGQGARSHDSYRIRLSNGYDSGAQPITQHNLEIHSGSATRGHRDAGANPSQGSQIDGG